jgi:hypothetical protein
MGKQNFHLCSVPVWQETGGQLYFIFTTITTATTITTTTTNTTTTTTTTTTEIWEPQASTSWNPQGLSRPVMRLLCFTSATAATTTTTTTTTTITTATTTAAILTTATTTTTFLNIRFECYFLGTTMDILEEECRNIAT